MENTSQGTSQANANNQQSEEIGAFLEALQEIT